MSDDYSRSLRLCSVVKRPDFDGYGFNLHAEKGKRGQYIGKVDDDSPAKAAGLKEGDRIVQVNGVDVTQENHKEVVLRIKAIPDRTELLVVDPAGDVYFKANAIELGLQCSYLVRLPQLSQDVKDSKEKEERREEKKEEHVTPQTTLEREKVTIESSHNSLNLNMTARELRAQLAARKKYDPKKDYSIDVKKKYDIIQKL